jgi:hypothetical protein
MLKGLQARNRQPWRCLAGTGDQTKVEQKVYVFSTTADLLRRENPKKADSLPPKYCRGAKSLPFLLAFAASD